MSKSSHSFSVDIAAQEGLIEAILLQHIHILQTSFLERDQDPDTSWVRRSVRAYHITYPYLTDKKISGALDRMEERDLIRSKIQNKVSYDRTKSVQLAQKGWAYFRGNAFDEKENGKDEKGNGIDQMGESLQGSYIPFVDSFVERENTPARAEISETVEAEEINRGLVPPPAEAAAPDIMTMHDPELPGVIIKEALPVATALTYDQHPNPRNSQELKEAMRNYFVANPREWQDGVLEQSHATNWQPEKIGDCMTAFCAHQEAEGNMKRTYGQYKGMLVKWFLAQPSFDRVKPGPAAQKPFGQPEKTLISNMRQL